MCEGARFPEWKNRCLLSMARSWLWFSSLLSVHTQIYGCLNEFLTKRSRCPHGWLSPAGGPGREVRGAGGRGGAGQRGQASVALVAPVLSPGHLPGAGRHGRLWPGEGRAGSPAPRCSPGHGGGLPPPAARRGRAERAGKQRVHACTTPGGICTKTSDCTNPPHSHGRVCDHAQSHGHLVGVGGGMLQAPTGRPSGTSEPGTSQGGPG